MSDEDSTIRDVEGGILADEMFKGQKDTVVTAECTYEVGGRTIHAGQAEVTARPNSTGSLVIITLCV